MRKSTTRSAFTLIELLVVVGIIALLISILLPALNRARQMAQTAQCLSNLRQISVALNAYQTSFKGYMTRSYDLLFPSRGESGAPDIVICPTYRKLAAQVDSSLDRNYKLSTGQSYGWNSWVDSIYTALAPVLWRPNSIKNSAELALYGDTISVQSAGVGFDFTRASSLNDVYGDYAPGLVYGQDGLDCFRANKLNRPSFQGRHNGRGSVLWLDGHATLESPTYCPDPSLYSGGGRSETPTFYMKYKIGYLVPPNTTLPSRSAMYYFLGKKSLANESVQPLMLWYYRPDIPYMPSGGWVARLSAWQ
ncbi:MAG: prepilin-type N-terminal cleavage/methylation domain-containing protein [Tepidisphaeraceae bacterium]